MKKKVVNFAFAIIFFVSLALCGCAFLFSANKISKVEAASGNWTDNCSSDVITGGGTQNNPYIIDTAVKFAYIAWGINNGYTQWNTAFYKQTANIDLSAHNWVPMNTFAGYYDGQGYTLSGLTCDSSLFQFAITKELSGTWINSGFKDVQISVSGQRQNYAVATLACSATSTAVISGCFVSGSIYVEPDRHFGQQTYDIYAGGLVTNSAAEISNCFAYIDINGTQPYVGATGGTRVGGIVGNITGGKISNCYSSGTLNVYGGYWKIGGIVAYPNKGTIENCAVLTGTCTQANTSRNDFINDQYNNEKNATVTNCKVLSADALKINTNSPLDTWDFSDNTTNRIWGYPSESSEFYNQGYPALRVFYESFSVAFNNETNTAVIDTKISRYPDYSVEFPAEQTKRGWTFDGWSTEAQSSGTLVGKEGTLANVIADANYFAHFTIIQYTLKVTKSHDEAATLAVDGNVTNSFEQSFDYDTTHALQISEIHQEFGYVFESWINADTNEILSTEITFNYTITDADIHIKAKFIPEQYLLRVYINDSSMGSTSQTTAYLEYKQNLQLTATPNAGYKIQGYYATRTRKSDGTYEYSDLLSSSSTYVVTMPRHELSIYVVFEKAPLTLTVLTYDGNVSSTGAPANPNMTEISISPNQTNYFVGDKITLSATVNENGQIEFNSTTYIFTRWKIGDFLKDGGDGVDPNNLTFTMPATDTVVYACFISTDAYYAFVDWQNNIVEEGIVSTTATITAPDISKFTKSGYSFDGFFSKNGTPLISVENGEYVSTYTLNGVTERVVFYPKYTKHFDCEIVFSLNNQKTTQYDINPNLSLYFACVSPTGHKFSSKIQDGEKTSINLSNETFVGEWLLNFVTPTYYEAKIFVNGVQNTTGLFDINILSNQIQIDIMLTKIADKYLYDSTQEQTSTNDVKIIDHYQYVDGVKTYTGVNKELKNHEFAPLSNEQTLTSPYGYENKDIIGTVNWGGLYNFTDTNFIEEGANITAIDLGSTVYKLSFSNNYASMYSYNYDWSKETVYSMTDLLYTKPFLSCFHRSDLKTFVLVAYEFATCTWNTLAYDGRSATELEPYLNMVRNEFAELVDNLMLEFRDENKIFILSNWEADNSFGAYCWDYIEALRGTISDDEVARRQQLALDFFTAYINARQDGIILGREKFASRGLDCSTVVYGNFEVNAATEEVPWTPTRPRAYSAIIPNTYCDLYSISDWYSIWTETGNNTEINWDAETDAYTITMFLDNIWSYVKQNRTFLPSNDPNYKPCIWNFGTDSNNPIKNLMITEFGSDETKENQRNFHHVKTTITEAINWGIYKITYWEIYTNVTNQTPVGAQPRVEDCQGLWLIRPDGTFSQGFWYMKSMIDGFDYFTNPLKLVYSSNYVDTHGLDWEKYKDTVIWHDDLVDTSKMKSFSQLYVEGSDNTDARLNFVDLSGYADYLNKYTGYFGYDTTGLSRYNKEFVDNGGSGVVSSLAGTLTQITYEAKSNRFGFLMYNYNSLSHYIDATTGKSFENPIVFIMGKNQYGNWEKITNTKVEEKLADGNSLWYQTYVSVVTPVNKYSEFRIVFNEELNYNIWDPILTSVFFFKGGDASSNYILG